MKATVCDCEKLCVREKPSKDSNILTIIDAGTVLQYKKSESEDWYSVTEINDIPATGYCMAKYVKVTIDHDLSDDRKEVKHGRRT